MNEEEKKLYLFMRNASPEVLNSFTDDDADEFERLHKLYQSEQTPTYKERAPSLLERVNKVGYSGLSDDDKKLYNAQFPHSAWAKADPKRTVEDAQRLTDQAVRDRQIREAPTDLPFESGLPGEYSLKYDDIRKGLSVPVGLATGTIQTGIDRVFGMPHKEVDGVAIPQEAPSLWENIKEGIRKGSEGEGFSGLAADPLNLSLFVPGLGEVALGGKFGAEIPTWGQALGRGVLGAAEGAGYGVGSILLDPTKKGQSLSDAALYGGVLGGLGGGAAGLLKRSAIDNFPGVGKIERSKLSGKKNTEMLDLSEAERARIYNMLPIFPNRTDYYDVAQDLAKSTGPAWKQTDDIFDKALESTGYPYGGINTEDIERIIRSKLDDATTAKTGILQNMAVEDVDKVIADYVASRMGGIRKTASKTPRKSVVDEKELLDVVPISNIGSILGQLNTDIGRGVGSKIPTAESKMALVAKDAIVSDILGGKGPITSRDDQIRGILTGGIMHNGEVKSYNDILEEIAPGTRADYSLGKRVLGTIAQQAETGPSVRVGVPVLGEAGPHAYLRVKSNYSAPATSWKIGSVLSKPIAAPTIQIGGDLVSAIRSKFEEKRKKK
jgi:hypothetical protein